MKTLFLFLALVILSASLYAVGTKKKKQKIHVRREFVSFTDIQSPQEYHDDIRAYHRLHCRNSGLQSCDWKQPPFWKFEFFTLETVDWLVASLARQAGSANTPRDEPGLILLSNQIPVRWWRLPNGYEYVVDEDAVGPDIDSARRAVADGRVQKGAHFVKF